MRQYYLITIYKKFGREADWLLAEFTLAMATLNLDSRHKASRLSAEMSLVRLHDCWARFSRELVVLSAGGKPLTASGQIVALAPGVQDLTKVIPTLIATFPKKKDEPNWAVPLDTIDAAKRLNIKNYMTVSDALGAVGSPAEEIRPVRNFLVHRSRRSALTLRQKLGPTYKGQLSIEAVAGAYVNPGIGQFEKWVIDLKNVALSAIQ